MNGMDLMEVAKAVNILRLAKSQGVMIWLAGNGGSASTASHFANDLIKQCGIKAMCLNDMVPTILAYGNDGGWQDMFSGPMRVMQPSPSDILILFSCSGESPNIIKLVEGWIGGQVVLFTGDNQDSSLIQSAKAHIILQVFNPDIMVQESVHLALCHAIVSALKSVRPANDSADALFYAMKQKNSYSD